MRLINIEYPKRPNRWVQNSLMAICLFLFVIVFGGCLFANSYEMTPVPLIAIMGITVVLLVHVNKYLIRHLQWLHRYYWILVGIGLTLLLSVNIVFGYMLRYEPIFDLGAIFTGATQWAQTGSFMEHMNWTCDDNYFYYFPNNLGGMTFLFAAFKIASIFGIVDYYAVAMITNAMLVALTVFLSILICRKILGTQGSIMALLCFLLFPPVYFMASVFYTDVLSMVFPVLIVLLYLEYMDAGSKCNRALLVISIGVTCAIGMLVKFTALIALISVVIYHFIHKGSIAALILASACTILIIGSFSAFNGYMYSRHLDKATAEQLKTPYSHWIMMSLEGDGRYNPQDFEFTRSFDDPAQRKEAILTVIKERVENKGIIGMLELFYKKGIAAFGDGTLAQSDFLDDNPRHSTFLHGFVLYDGEHHGAYRYVSSGIYFSFLLLTCVAAYRAMLQKGGTVIIIPILCVCGIMLFLLIWEVSARYATNFVPMIILCAIQGVTSSLSCQPKELNNTQLRRKHSQ